MKNQLRLPVVVLAGVLALSACSKLQGPHAAPRPAGPPPGGPNDPVPAAYLRGTEFDKPTMIHYSWGILDSPPLGSDGPQVQYRWSEVRRRLAARSQ